MKSNSIKVKILSFVLVLSIFFLWLVCAGGIAPVRADSTVYSNVLEDLQKDDNFDKSAYVVNATDYSLQLVQIAESTDGELFIYVFNPSYESKPITATTIRLSTAINENYSPSDYGLTKLSEDSGFTKYVLNEFTVKADALRYYSIVCLHRAYDAELDGESDTVNVISEVPIEVAQLWTASTVNGVVTYSYVYDEVITITDRWDGFVVYDIGFDLFNETCRSHFIAFNTDKQMDKLLEANVTFVHYRVTETYYTLTNKTTVTKGDPQFEDLTLTCDQEGATEPGWFHEKYTWKRIVSTDDFLADADIDFSEEAKENISNKAWVLRFYETEYATVTQPSGMQSDEYYTEVSEVTILRLKFQTDGETYNLGVVDDKRASDDEADGTGVEHSLWDRILAWIIFIVAIVVGLAVIKYVLRLLIQVLSGNMHGIAKLIFSIFLFAVFGVYCLLLINFAIPAIVDLGGLGVAALDTTFEKISGW